MVQELLSRVPTKAGHIILLFALSFIGISANAQSVLLPGDVVIVTANSTDDTFDFIPLVDLQKGTTLTFRNGRWDSVAYSVKGGTSLGFTLIEEIEAGTNIHIDGESDPRYLLSGSLTFEDEGNRIFVLQEEEGIDRVIFGIGWGHPDVWDKEAENGSAIPASISKEDNTLLALGDFDNYQYYLRNGASGTISMLADFVSDPAKWRGKNEQPFAPFRTTFRLLSSPVVQFDENVSTNTEGEFIILNVAIYEHDGSRLTVEAHFQEAFSTADTGDIQGFESYLFNFTGLIGNAVYSIEIPLKDDQRYTGSKNAFFELRNLSKGNFGDAVGHVAFINDNEMPNVMVNRIITSGNAESRFIEISNNERVPVSLKGWSISSKGFIYDFPPGSVIDPGSSLRVYHPEARGDSKDKSWPKGNSGILELKDQSGSVISVLNYHTDVIAGRIQNNTGNDVDLTRSLTQQNVDIAGISGPETDAVPVKPLSPGWYVSRTIAESADAYVWEEKSQSFRELTASEVTPKDQVYLIFRDDEMLEAMLSDTTSKMRAAEPAGGLTFTLSGTDSDENGVINGGEGMNLILNSSDQPVPVSDLMKKLEEELNPGALYPFVYAFDHGKMDWSEVHVLSEYDSVPPGAAFIIRADTLIEEIIFEYQLPEIPVIPAERMEEEEDVRITLRLSGEEGRGSVKLNLFEADKTLPVNIIQPAIGTTLGLFSEGNVFLGMMSDMNWNSEVNITKADDERMVLPLAFQTFDPGVFTLSVAEWSGLPADWNVLIEDRSTGKIHELRSDWKLEFDHFSTKEGSNEKLTISEQHTPDQRFILILLPPGTEHEEFDSPQEITLGQNYPNPFNPTTTISFYLPESMRVKLSVFNVVGQPVTVLAEGVLGEGDHTYEWNASGLPSGMYIYQLEVGTKVMTQKMTLVK